MKLTFELVVEVPERRKRHIQSFLDGYESAWPQEKKEEEPLQWRIRSFLARQIQYICAVLGVKFELLTMPKE